MLHPALLLGEGDGDTAGEADVGNEDDEDAGSDDEAVVVEIGADDVDAGNEALIGGLGVFERVCVREPTKSVEARDGLKLVAATEADPDEADEESDP
jgi:hypothetical protein